MATLLNGVNEILKRNGIISEGSPVLTSLTDSNRQVLVDTAVQAINATLEELFSITERSWPNQLAENTITLVTGDRDYALQSDVEQLKFPLIDETNGRYIHEYEGGYEALVADQPIPSNFTGLPIFGAIRTTDAELYLDREPTASENGLIYKYRYEKDVSLSIAADTFPVTDIVYRAITGAAAEYHNLLNKKEFSDALWRSEMARAARRLSRTPERVNYRPDRFRTVNRSGIAFPFDD